MMNVELIEYMGTDLSVVDAARVSYARKSQWEVPFADKILSARDVNLIKDLAKHKHFSPFTHPQLSMRVKVPIFVARQLLRHQVGLTINEVSRRYVDDSPEFYMPSEWRKRAKNKKDGSEDVHEDSLTLFKKIENLNESIKGMYVALIKQGVAPEQVRMILPQSMYTEFIWTGSLMAFIRVCKLRVGANTQKETREIAQMIKNILLELFPYSVNAWFELED